jgi:hypothetical protein
MKKIMSFILLLPFAVFGQDRAPGFETLILPVTKIIENKGGSFDLRFYVHPKCGFIPAQAKLILLSDTFGKAPKSYEVERFTRIEQDSLLNTTAATIIANDELKKEFKKQKPRVAIMIKPEIALHYDNDKLAAIIKNGTYLVNHQNKLFYSVDSFVFQNYTIDKQNEVILRLVYAANTLGMNIKNTTQDRMINKGKYFGLKLSNLLEKTNAETVDQYLIYLMIERHYYAGMYLPFLDNYCMWIENGAVVDVKRF